MPRRKQTNADGKVGLKLSAVERKVLLIEVMFLDRAYEEVLRNTPTSKPIMLTLDRWDDLGGHIAAEVNHTKDKKSQRKLDALFFKIDDLVSSYPPKEPRFELKIYRPQEE